MASVSLVPYTIRFKTPRKEDFLCLDNINGHSLHDLFLAYLNRRKAARRDDKGKHFSHRVLKIEDANPSIYGLVDAGDWGIESKFVHLNTGETLEREKEHCEFIHFFISLVTNPGENEALLIMQRLGAKGWKTSFEEDFKSYLRHRNIDAVMQIYPVVTEEILRELISGGLKKIRYIKHSVPDDVAEDLGMTDNKEILGDFEVSVSAKRSLRMKLTGLIQQYMMGDIEVGQVLEIMDVKFDDLKIECELNGRPKVVTLSEARKLHFMSIDISEKVKAAPNGIPDSEFENVKKESAELAKDVASELGWQQ